MVCAVRTWPYCEEYLCEQCAFNSKIESKIVIDIIIRDKDHEIYSVIDNDTGNK